MAMETNLCLGIIYLVTPSPFWVNTSPLLDCFVNEYISELDLNSFHPLVIISSLYLLALVQLSQLFFHSYQMHWQNELLTVPILLFFPTFIFDIDAEQTNISLHYCIIHTPCKLDDLLVFFVTQDWNAV